MENESVKLILSYTEKSDISNYKNAEKLLMSMENHSFKLKHMEFPRPDISYVFEMSEAFNKQISDDDAQVILAKSNGNVVKIINELRNDYKYQEHNKSVVNFILPILAIYGMELSVSDIGELVKLSDFRHIINKDDIINGLKYLESRYLGIIKLFENTHNEIVALFKGQKDELLKTSNCDPATQLVSKDLIVRHLYKSFEHLSFDQLVLGYNLINELELELIRSWSKRLVVEALTHGRPVEKQWIESIAPTTLKEKFVCAIGLFRRLNYVEAKDILIELFHEHKNNRDIKLLLSLTLNRCRNHQGAEHLLIELIESSTSERELSILLAVSVVNYIHKKDLDGGRILTEKHLKIARASNQYGYFLRNAASLYESEDSYAMWTSAINSFEECNDDYGIHTTYANMARYYHYAGNTGKAIKILTKAYYELSKYGEEQMHLVSNNLGVCHLLNENFYEAKKYLKYSISISKSIMPKTYAVINLCGYYIAKGDYDKAYVHLIHLELDVMSTNLHRLKARYSLAMSVISHILGNIKSAEIYLNNYECFRESASKPAINKIYQRLCNVIGEEFDSNVSWKDYFFPCFLEYWIFNPLCALSDDALSV